MIRLAAFQVALQSRTVPALAEGYRSGSENVAEDAKKRSEKRREQHRSVRVDQCKCKCKSKSKSRKREICWWEKGSIGILEAYACTGGAFG